MNAQGSSRTNGDLEDYWDKSVKALNQIFLKIANFDMDDCRAGDRTFDPHHLVAFCDFLREESGRHASFGTLLFRGRERVRREEGSGAMVLTNVDMYTDVWWGHQLDIVESLVPTLYKDTQPPPEAEQQVYMDEEVNEYEEPPRPEFAKRNDSPSTSEALLAEVHSMIDACRQLFVPNLSAEETTARAKGVLRGAKVVLGSYRHNPIAHSYDYLVEGDKGGRQQRPERVLYYENGQRIGTDADWLKARRHDDLNALLRRLVFNATYNMMGATQLARQTNDLGDLMAASIRLTKLHRAIDKLEEVGKPELLIGYETPTMSDDQRKANAYAAVSDKTKQAVGYNDDVREFVQYLIDRDRINEVTELDEPLDRLISMIDVACGIVIGLLHLRSLSLPFPIEKYQIANSYDFKLYNGSNLRELEQEEAEYARLRREAKERERALRDSSSMDTSKSLTDSLIDAAIGRLRR